MSQMLSPHRVVCRWSLPQHLRHPIFPVPQQEMPRHSLSLPSTTTLKKVFIDVERKTWAPQMLFVAISRVRKLQDLIIAPFDLQYVNDLKKSKTFDQRFAEERRLQQLAECTQQRWDASAEMEAMDVDSAVEEMDVDIL